MRVTTRLQASVACCDLLHTPAICDEISSTAIKSNCRAITRRELEANDSWREFGERRSPPSRLADTQPCKGAYLMAITASFNAAAGLLSIFSDNLDNTVTVSRNAAGNILINGGAVPVLGGNPTVANTALIQAFGLGGNDNLLLDEFLWSAACRELVRRRRQRHRQRWFQRRSDLRAEWQRCPARARWLRSSVRRRRQRHADRRRCRRPAVRRRRRRSHDLEPRRRHRPVRRRHGHRYRRGQWRRRRGGVRDHRQWSARALRPPGPRALRHRYRHKREVSC